MPRNYVAKAHQKAPGTLTPEKRAKFFEVLKTGVSMAGAAHAAGVSHGYVYDLKAKDAEFSAEIDSCRESGSDRMEDMLLGIGAKQSNVTALIFLLKGRRPDVYRERVQNDLISSDGTLAGLFSEATHIGAAESAHAKTNGAGKESV